LKEMSGALPFIAFRPCGCVFSDAAIRAVIPNLTKGIGAKAVPKADSPDEAKPLNGEANGKGTVACPNCGTSIEPTKPESILPVNPSREVQEILLEHLLTTRAAAKSSKKRKAAAIKPAADGVKNGDVAAAPASHAGSEEPPSKLRREMSESPAPSLPAFKAARSSASPGPRATPPLAPTSLARSVHQKLAEQEQKRLAAQAGMSDAVKSMFRPKEQGKPSDTADFFGRTFTRVSNLGYLRVNVLMDWQYAA
jgi:hypothetical protein